MLNIEKNFNFCKECGGVLIENFSDEESDLIKLLFKEEEVCHCEDPHYRYNENLKLWEYIEDKEWDNDYI